MFVSNELLFNSAFLNQLAPSPSDKEGMYSLVRSARAWLRQADFSSPSTLLDTFLRPFLLSQSLDLVPGNEYDPHAMFLVAPWDPGARLGAFYIAPREDNLDGYDPTTGRLPKGQHWMIRAVEAARAAGLRWAVLTDGERWRLLDAEGLRRYEAYLEIDLLGLAQAEQNQAGEGEYEMAAYLFATLFRLEGSFARDEQGCSGLDEFIARSLRATERSERYLKQTVCDHLETPGGGDGIMAQLCMGLVRAVDSAGSRTFTEAERGQIYRDATYLLYRLLFILYAEARGLLPADNPHYQDVGLRQLIDAALLLRSAPQRAAARPTLLWDRLATLFNLVDTGDPGPAQIPAFDGGLFDNSDHPYLRDYRIENIYLAEALVQLTFQPGIKSPDDLERLDYRDLSVRHLGSLYEGMIEYRLYIAEEDLLARTEKEGRVRYLPARGSSRQPNDEVVPTGRVYFAQSPHERKSTGTHYTAEDLVEKLVRQTALRLVDERWAAFEGEFGDLRRELENTPPARAAAMQGFIDQRLQTFVEEQILSLRVCDPAMGSGHFLVHTAHQLTNTILHALARTAWANPEIDLSPAFWRRQVVESCLYGVDINPMAVELAKLSLWLASMTPGRPLSFLDHRLKAGNSLLGVRFDEIVAALQESDFNRPTKKSAIAEARGQYGFKETSRAEQAAEEAVRLLDSLVHRDARSLTGVDAQKQDYRSAQERLEAYRRVGDFLTALKMGLKFNEVDAHAVARTLERGGEPSGEEQRRLLSMALLTINSQAILHWDLQFPDAFLQKSQQGGFDVVLGNPPFLGGLKIGPELGNNFLSYLLNSFDKASGLADLSAYFFRLAFSLLKTNGILGMVATNTISQGDTKEVSLDVILEKGGVIIYADQYVKWAGDATVEVNLISILRSPLHNNKVLYPLLNGVTVPYISSKLDDLPKKALYSIIQNERKAFIGDYVRGLGFVLDKAEADYLISKNGDYGDCVLPYINGSDINKGPQIIPDRYVICFYDWDLRHSSRYTDLIKILEERVKPFRDKVKQTRDKENWWLFSAYRKELREATTTISNVFVRSRISETHALVLAPTSWILNEKTIVFAFDDFFHFSLLQSNIHEMWMRRYTSTLRTDINYAPSDCFMNFPFPQEPFIKAKIYAEDAGQTYYAHRQSVMNNRQLGLTKSYNLFHDPECQTKDIETLRELHAAMNIAVLNCYGWNDIELQHDFYPNDRRKIRFMPCRAAQREIFTRLMDLNQRIAAEEASRGLSPAAESEDEGNIEE